MRLILFLIIASLFIFSCSKENSNVTKEIQKEEETSADPVDDSPVDDSQDGDENGDEVNSNDNQQPRVIDGLTLSENAIDVTLLEFQLDTIVPTGEIQIRLPSGTGGKSLKIDKSFGIGLGQSISDIKVGSVLMDNIKGFLVEVVEIRDEVLIVVDASLDQFFFSGITSILQTSLEGSGSEVNTTELDLSFDFNKSFQPVNGLSVTFRGQMQWNPIFKTEVDYEDKSIEFSLNPINRFLRPEYEGDQKAHLEGAMDVTVSSSVSEEIELKIGSVEKTFLAGPIFTTVRVSLLYRPNVSSSVAFTDSRSLGFDLYPIFKIKYDNGGLKVLRNDVGFAVDNDGLFPQYETDLNFSIGHGLFLKTEVLFFKKVGIFAEGGFERLTTYRSNGTDWDIEQPSFSKARVGITQKLFNQIGEEPLVYEESNSTEDIGSRSIKIPGRVYQLDKLDLSRDSQVIRFAVYPDDFSYGFFYLEPTLNNLDYDKGVPNVKIYFNSKFASTILECETPVTFNGLASTVVETNSEGIAEVLIKPGLDASTYCDDPDGVTYEPDYGFRGPQLWIKNGNGDIIINRVRFLFEK